MFESLTFWDGLIIGASVMFSLTMIVFGLATYSGTKKIKRENYE